MTPERLRQIETALHAVRERRPEDRPAALTAACGDDAALRREVESLLGREGAALIDASLSAVVADLGSMVDARRHQPGERIGAYVLGPLLGAGGMGEVYRAHDTTLGRDVAIKILPEIVAADPDRLERFDREARTLASLNHPYIGAIYGVVVAGSVRGLVLELVEGDTLAERLEAGALPMAQALTWAIQIADALDAAHEKGIVHRDLKPANIKITASGGVKVLDFGLAKVVTGDGPAAATLSRATWASAIVRTAGYMSPEQARGLAVDRRTDMWAFGCVLFEMLTARPVFIGESIADVLAAVIHQDPDFGALPATTPQTVRALLQRCLQRDQRERQRDVGDACLELRQSLKALDAGSGVTSSALAQPRQRDGTHRGAWLISAAIVAAVTIGGIAAYSSRPLTPARAFMYSILPPEGASFLNVSQGGAPALSPDGRLVAFVANGRGGQMLWVRSVDAFDDRPLPGTEGARSPFWSPDGRYLGFVAQGNLSTVALGGGPPQSLAAAVSLAGAWNPDGTILFASEGGSLATISSSGGPFRPATEMNASLQDENHFLPVFLPDARHYLLQVRGGPELEWQVWVGELGSNNRRLLVRRVTNALYAASRTGGPGYVLYVRDRTLMAQPFDADRLALTGDSVAVAQRVAISATTGSGDFSVSRNGVLAYRSEHPPQEEMAWLDRSGKRIETLGDQPGNPRNNLRLSPDGTLAAFTRQGAEYQDVWIYDLARGVASRFTFGGGRSPVWHRTVLRSPTCAATRSIVSRRSRRVRRCPCGPARTCWR